MRGRKTQRERGGQQQVEQVYAAQEAGEEHKSDKQIHMSVAANKSLGRHNSMDFRWCVKKAY